MSQCGSGHMTTGGDQGGQGVPGVAQVSGDKLSCADSHLWSKVVRLGWCSGVKDFGWVGALE